MVAKTYMAKECSKKVILKLEREEFTFDDFEEVEVAEREAVEMAV